MTATMLLGLAAQASAEIVVTGRALPPPEASLATGVTIERADLNRSASGRLERVLGQVAGIQTFRRADSASAHPTSAGLTARGLGGNAASRMLLIVDGVPQSDPFGGWMDFPLYSPGRIARVTVERGGGQARWGSGAIAGVVEVDSLGPGDGAAVSAAARLGSRESADLSGTVLAGGETAYVLAGATFRRSDGFVPIIARDRGPADRRAPFRQANAQVRGALMLSPEVELQGGVQLVDDRRERGLADSSNRSRGGDVSIRLVGRGSTPFQIALYRQVRRFESLFAAASADRSTSRVTLDQFRVPARGWGGRGEIDLGRGPVAVRIGADLRTGKGTTKERYQFVNGVPTRLREAGGAFATAGLFAQLGGSDGRWRWAVDGRIDRWSLTDGRFEQRLIAGDILDDIDFADRRGWKPGGRVSIAWEAGAARLHAAAYRGWRLPTLNELYRPFRVGSDAVAANAGLKPETLVGAEAGLRLRPASALAMTATAFVNRLDNAIANVTLGQGPGVFPGVGFVAAGGTYSQRLNVDAIETVGAELDATWRRGLWQAGLSASLVRARVKGGARAPALDGKRPAQIPAFAVAANAAWTPRDDAWLALDLRYEGRRFDDDLNRQRLRGALTLDGSAQWPLTRHLAVTGAVENLFGAEVRTGFSGTAVERSRPRTVWLGLALRPGMTAR